VAATITLGLEVAADPAAAFDAFAEELARRGFGESSMAAWGRGRVARIEWPASEWEPVYEDDELELLARDAGFAEATATRPGYGSQLLIARKR
jgi:hypothetical protein